MDKTKMKQLQGDNDLEHGEAKSVDTTKKCLFCAETIQAEAKICRFCNRNLTATESAKHESFKMTKDPNTGKSVVFLLILGAWAWWQFGGGFNMSVQRDVQNIHNTVAADFEKQYGIANRSGNAMDSCVQAGIVSAAYLQAKDDANYQKWKEIEKSDCARAGIPK
ncbi:MAG: hypothetical protein H7145_15685 [Akkermansiaceae bacterium]|nr:hypothetical protein [Armatimonadota bacterium]